MDQHDDRATSFMVLDGAALVAGAAVAAVHIRRVIDDPLAGSGWVLAWATFVMIALTAAGPFLLLFRALQQRRVRSFKPGEVVWGILGTPWIVAAVLAAAARGPDWASAEQLTTGLSLGLAIVGSIAVIWETWVTVTADKAATSFSGPWTNRVGLVLGVAWPLQCGMGLVVMG
jgi:hypothetical protein